VKEKSHRPSIYDPSSDQRDKKKKKKKKFVKIVREEPVALPAAKVVDRHSSSQHQQCCLSSGKKSYISGRYYSALSGIRLVHRRDFAGDSGPFHLAAQRAAAALALEFFPLEKFVSAAKSCQILQNCDTFFDALFPRDLRESQVGLDDDVQSTRAHEAVGAWERQTELVHDFGNADGCGTGDAHAAVYQSGGTISAASFCRIEWSVRIRRLRTGNVTHQ